jgi:hypothetical protein
LATAHEIDLWLVANARPLPYFTDEVDTTVHFAGGLRNAKVGADSWVLLPLLAAGAPAQSAPLSRSQMVALTIELGLKPRGFHDRLYVAGKEYQHWVPYTGQNDNLASHPASLWANIGSNEGRRASRQTSAPVRILGEAISLSLRGMDIALSALSDFYFQRLIECLREGGSTEVRVSTSMDYNLAVNVHSLALHFGAARDYLGALIGHRAGLDFTSPKNNSLARVLGQLKVDASAEPMFAPFIEHGLLTPEGKRSGWLEEFSNLRDVLVHRRPHGHHRDEQYGRLRQVGAMKSLFAYDRQLVRDGEESMDALDVLSKLYRSAMLLFGDVARASGYSLEGLTLTDEDFVDEPEIIYRQP